MPNPKEELFVLCYVRTFDRTPSYCEAFSLYRTDKSQYKTACTEAKKLLNKDNVRARIKFLMDQRVQDMVVKSGTKEEIEGFLCRMINSDLTKFMKWDSDANLKLVDSDFVDGRLIESLSVTRDAKGRVQRAQLKLFGKEKPLEMLARIKGLMQETQVVSGVLTIEQREAANRAYIDRTSHPEEWLPKQKLKLQNPVD